MDIQKHKFWIIGGAIVGVGGLVIAWMNYESSNQANADNNANAAEEEQLLSSLMAAPLSSASGSDSYNEPVTGVDSTGLDSLINSILNPGSGAGSTGTSSGTGNGGSNNPVDGTGGSGGPDNGSGTTSYPPGVGGIVTPVGPAKVFNPIGSSPVHIMPVNTVQPQPITSGNFPIVTAPVKAYPTTPYVLLTSGGG